jgi:hypothetical protein
MQINVINYKLIIKYNSEYYNTKNLQYDIENKTNQKNERN